MTYKEKIKDIVEGIKAHDFETSGVAQVKAKQITEIIDGIAFDASTDSGRKEIRSAAYVLAQARSKFDKIGKDHKAALTVIGKTIDAERNAFKNPLESLQARLMAPIVEMERKDAARIQEHEGFIGQIVNLRSSVDFITEDEISRRLKSVSSLMQRDYEEFSQRANDECTTTQNILEELRPAAVERERIRAEEEKRRADEFLQAEDKRRADAHARALEQVEREKQAALQRIEDDKLHAEREAQARANNAAHARSIKTAAKKALIATGLSEDQARTVVIAILKGEIPSIRLEF